MDDDFFTENGQTLAAQSYQPPIHHQSHHEDEFQYANQQTHNQEVTHQTTQWQSSSNIYQEDEVAKNIRLQEEKIQERLRQKANEEYQLKQKRKEKGSKDLQTFFQKKSEQAEARKIQNRKKQKEVAQQKNSETAQGWAKVSKSVNLKQGQYKGQKDINRMRQAIIHKRQDQTI